jgi:exodeoxyribonuclease VIII
LPSLALAVDLKTTEDASPRGFTRSISKYGYHRQEAFYRRGFSAAGQGLDQFLFIAVEKTPPFAVGIYAVDSQSVGFADMSIGRELERFSECLKRDEWPGYGDAIEILHLPEWAQ